MKLLKEKKVDAKIWECNLEEKEEESKAIIRQIKQKAPDFIFTIGSKATILAYENIKDIPIVFSMVLAPVVTSTNITGVTLNIPVEATLKTLKRILPKAKRIGLIYSEKSEGIVKTFTAYEEMDLKLISKKIKSEMEFPDALKNISKRIDCFLMHADPSVYSMPSTQYLLKTSLAAGLPVIGLSLSYVKAGALFSLDCDYEDIGKQSAEIALRILMGERADLIPFLHPRKQNLCLNLIVAERLGIKIPKKIIKEALVVIKE